MTHSALQDILILLGAAILVVTFFKKLNLSPVLGYLFAGIAIGPYGFDLVSYNTATAYLAEFGVVFLLFYIGLELSFERLKSMRLYVFGIGFLQVAITSSIFILICNLVGLNYASSIIIGTGLALSSTAVVLKVLAEQGEEMTRVGRVSISILIFQDIVVVFLLVLVPSLAKDPTHLPSTMLHAGLKALLAVAIMLAAGRWVIKPLFNFIGTLKSEEIFAATTLMVVLLSSFVTENFGLSLALGAFLAGLMMAETEFRHQVEANILPFKSLLLGLFFMSVGMLVDIQLLQQRAWEILAISGAVLVVKAGIIFFLCRLFGFKTGKSLHAGLVLAQIGEFAFIMFGQANHYELLEGELYQMLLVSVSLTMALTPLMAMIGQRLSRHLKQNIKLSQEELVQELRDLNNHIVIAGFGRVGRVVAKVLMSQKESFVAIDNDIKNVREGRKLGFPVYFGDTANPELMSSIGLKRAKGMILTLNDKRISSKIASLAARAMPGMPIIARGWDLDHVKQLEKAGATLALAEAYEIGLHMATASLERTGTNEQEIERLLKAFRVEDYRLLKELSSRKA